MESREFSSNLLHEERMTESFLKSIEMMKLRVDSMELKYYLKPNELEKFNLKKYASTKEKIDILPLPTKREIQFEIQIQKDKHEKLLSQQKINKQIEFLKYQTRIETMKGPTPTTKNVNKFGFGREFPTVHRLIRKDDGMIPKDVEKILIKKEQDSVLISSKDINNDRRLVMGDKTMKLYENKDKRITADEHRQKLIDKRQKYKRICENYQVNARHTKDRCPAAKTFIHEEFTTMPEDELQNEITGSSVFPAILSNEII